jgi:hypothetical protein
MADINQVVTLGIGTPADIPHFLLLGLSLGAAPVGDPSVMDLSGAYQPTIAAAGRSQPTLYAVGTSQPAMDLAGQVED